MNELRVEGVSAGYVRTDVLRAVDLSVAPGQCVAVLGPNGAGKSTLLKVLTGQLGLHGGRRTVNGADAGRWRSFRFARAGVRWTGDPRPVYPSFTVLENLAIGGSIEPRRVPERVESVMELMPALKEKATAQASTLSGGQQQLLAIAQALMSDPQYLCLDEPSLGLSVHSVAVVVELIGQLAARGVGVVWAEQFPQLALEHCTQVALLSAGRVLKFASPDQVSQEELTDAYLGRSGGHT